MKNKQVKQMIASVAGARWVVIDQPKPELMTPFLWSHDDWRVFIAFHRVIPIKASEVK